MKTIQFNNNKYKIPESWEDVTLKMQMLVSTVASEQAYVKTIGILAGYTSIPVEELKAAKIGDLERIMGSMGFMKTPIPEEPVMEFSHNGEDYQVATNMLDQQFQDYVAIQTAIAEYGDNKWLLTPYILAVMAKRGAEETLDDFDIMERAKLFEDIPVPIANGITAFFLTSSKASKFITMFSSPVLQESILHAKVKELEDSVSLLRKQRGGNILIRLWTMILRRYIKSLSCQLVKFYSSPVSKPSKKKWKQTFRRLLLRKPKERSNKN